MYYQIIKLVIALTIIILVALIIIRPDRLQQSFCGIKDNCFELLARLECNLHENDVNWSKAK